MQILRRSSCFFLLQFTLLLTLWACQNNKEKDQANSEKVLRIAVAANMRSTAEELLRAFEAEHGIVCELVSSSSGKLTAQIMQGAPYDVFLSADLDYPTVLFEKEFTTGPPRIYAEGSLVLWTLKEGMQPSLTVLDSDQIQRIALANPKIAPYGMAAQTVLERSGLIAGLSKKLVYGESLGQTNQFIASGAAEIGFTSKSAALEHDGLGHSRWIELDKDLYAPLEQAMVLLKSNSELLPEAELFQDFVFSDIAEEIFLEHGYKLNQ